jgi:hypothetical protein
VILFIDRLRLKIAPASYAGMPGETCYPLLPIILTGPDERNPPPAQSMPWKLDTGNALEASAYRFHLEEAGLNPDDLRHPRSQRITTADGHAHDLPIRMVGLWLVSNIPALQARPYLLPLATGMPFFDQSPAQPRRYPLLGMGILLRAGLRVQFDLSRLTLSVWVPGWSLRNLALWLRRLPGGFRTLPLGKIVHKEEWTWPNPRP